MIRPSKLATIPPLPFCLFTLFGPLPPFLFIWSSSSPSYLLGPFPSLLIYLVLFLPFLFIWSSSPPSYLFGPHPPLLITIFLFLPLLTYVVLFPLILIYMIPPPYYFDSPHPPLLIIQSSAHLCTVASSGPQLRDQICLQTASTFSGTS